LFLLMQITIDSPSHGQSVGLSTACKAYSHSNLLFFLIGAESLVVVLGAGMIHLSLCLRS
jgi:hypothetical protein